MPSLPLLRCPNCERELKIRDEQIGHRVACKFCEYHFRIPEMVLIPCPSCGQAGRARTESLGHKTRCKGCRHVFVASLLPVPNSQEVPVGQWEAIQSELEAARRRAEEATSEHERLQAMVQGVEEDRLRIANELAERERRDRTDTGQVARLRADLDAAAAANRTIRDQHRETVALLDEAIAANRAARDQHRETLVAVQGERDSALARVAEWEARGAEWEGKIAEVEGARIEAETRLGSDLVWIDKKRVEAWRRAERSEEALAEARAEFEARIAELRAQVAAPEPTPSDDTIPPTIPPPVLPDLGEAIAAARRERDEALARVAELEAACKDRDAKLQAAESWASASTGFDVGSLRAALDEARVRIDDLEVARLDAETRLGADLVWTESQRTEALIKAEESQMALVDARHDFEARIARLLEMFEGVNDQRVDLVEKLNAVEAERDALQLGRLVGRGRFDADDPPSTLHAGTDPVAELFDRLRAETARADALERDLQSERFQVEKLTENLAVSQFALNLIRPGLGNGSDPSVPALVGERASLRWSRQGS